MQQGPINLVQTCLVVIRAQTNSLYAFSAKPSCGSSSVSKMNKAIDSCKITADRGDCHKPRLSKQGCVTVVRSSATPPKVFKAKQNKTKVIPQEEKKRRKEKKKSYSGRLLTASVGRQ